MCNFKIKLLTALMAFLSIASISAQDIDKLADSIISKTFIDKNGPGGVFMIAHKGKPIVNKAYGMANLESDVAMNIHNVFQIGSMTKQFTAVAIMMLYEEGKLDFQDPINKYILDYPMGEKITIHHLLTHTSGIKDFTKMKTIRDIAQKEMTPQMMVDFFKNETPEFAPGEKFEYNNSGYVLLGYLIELVSGKSYESFIENNIFSKIGMQHSLYASEKELVKNRAYGYHKKDSIYVNKTIINYSVPYASGALMSNAEDMLIWQNAISHNLLLKKETLEKAFATYNLINGEKLSYGYGWHIKEMEHERSLEHGGSIFGYKSMGVYIPSEDIYVLGLSNCDCHSPTQVTRDLANMYLKYLK
jgi:CubicO group peptidase (beta-lactamase class C family)